MTRVRGIYTDNQILGYPRQPLRQLTSPTRMALAIRGDPRHPRNPCSIDLLSKTTERTEDTEN
jgi:hypothetical protein